MNKLRILFGFFVSFFFVTHVFGEEHNPYDLTINVECNPIVTVDSVFTINYIVSYNGKDSKDVKFTFGAVESNLAKFLFFDRTNHVFESKNIGINKIKTTQTDTWTATWKALKAGMFLSPSYRVAIVNGINVDTLDIQPICKKIRISNTDRKIIKQKENERKETIKRVKCKNNVLAIAEIAQQEFGVGDTIHCKIYLLNKVIEPSANIQDVAIDKAFSIKECSYELTWLEEVNFDEIDYNGSRYQKIGFAEILIIPGMVGEIKIPPIKLYGHKQIQMYEKSRYISNLPVVIDTFQYTVFTNPLRVSIK